MAEKAIEQSGWKTRLLNYFGVGKRPDAAIGTSDIADEKEGNTDTTFLQEKLNALRTAKRVERYKILTELGEFDLVKAVVSLIAEEAVQPDYDRGVSVWVECADRKVVDAANVCFANVRMEARRLGMATRLALLGDEMRRPIYAGGKGVFGWKRQDPAKIFRVEDNFDRLVGFRVDGMNDRFRGELKRSTSWPWDYIHYRTPGNDEGDRYGEYGESMVAACYRPAKQAVLSEDALLTYRMQRTPGRNVLFVSVNDLDAVDRQKYIRELGKRLKKTEFIDPTSAQYKQEYMPITPAEDIVIPVAGADPAGQGTRIEQLAGADDVGPVNDLQYYISKFAGATRVPKQYLGFEGAEGDDSKATLMQKDVRFARTIKRMRTAMLVGDRTLLDINFQLIAAAHPEFDPTKLTYLVKMPPSSYLDEFERLNLVKLRVEVVQSFAQIGEALKIDPKVWATYVLITYAKIPEKTALNMIMDRPEIDSTAPVTDDALRKTESKYGLPVGSLTESIGTAGYTTLSAAEQLAIAKMMHTSPGLRKVVGDLSEYSNYDESQQSTQIDWSMYAPRVITLGKDESGSDKKVIGTLDEATLIKYAGTARSDLIHDLGAIKAVERESLDEATADVAEGDKENAK